MKMDFRNIGKFRRGSISIDGLTILAGLNGSGKSTILKSIYCMLAPSVNFYKMKDDELERYLRSIYFRIPDKSLHNIEFKGPLNPDFINFLKEYVENTDDKIVKSYIDNYFKLHNSDYAYLRKFIERLITLEFGSIGQLKSFDVEGEAVICLSVDGKDYELKITDEDSITWDNDMIGVDNIAYYDSPFVLDSYIGESKWFHRDNMVGLLRSSENASFEILNSEAFDKFNSIVREIFQGEIVTSRRRFEYLDSKGHKLDFKNMAAGMKIFGIIKQLMKNGNLNNNSVLLLDEPEIHLHPKWIMALAEIILLLVKEFGVKIVLSTHNPQLLMCLQSFSHKYEVNTKYYHLVESDSTAELMDVSENPDEIYSELAEPMERSNELYWDVGGYE